MAEFRFKENLKTTRRGLFRAGIRLGIAGAASSLLGLHYAEGIEPEELEIKEVSLNLARLSSAFDGYRIAQLSDIHFDGLPGDAIYGDGWMTAPRLQRAVRRVNSLQPDAIAITGDLVSTVAKPFTAPLIEALKDLRARDGVFAVLGNHDYWEPQEVCDILQRAGAIVLNNSAHTIQRGKEVLHIAGIDDVWNGKPDLNKIVTALPSTGAAILLAHEPDFADMTVQTGRFDLQLSGHSHGGQVCLPGRGPIHLPYLGEKYHTGLYQVQATTGETMLQYTNRGLGMVRPYVRFCCAPEITVITLRSPHG